MLTTQITRLLGGPKVVGEMLSPFEIARAVRVGLPWAAFEAMEAALSIPARQLAAMLHIPPRTLSRRKDAGRLEAMESDRLCRLARVVAHAVDVFESQERARDWLETENRALGGQRPLELLDTDAGAREVDDVLGRIEHGIFS